MIPPEELHRPLYTVDILVNALETYGERPLVQLLDGPMLTVRDVRDATSQFVQALAAKGAVKGTRIAILSSNLPEVIHVAHACQVLAAVSVPMHPLQGIADHIHVVNDAEVDLLVFEPGRFGERAAELLKARPGLTLLSFGPSDIADDLIALAESMTPQKLVAPVVHGSDVMRLGYSGGTTGKPKSLPSVQRTGLATLNIMMGDWEWPATPRVLSCAPLSHAGSAMIMPTLLKGGTVLVLPGFDPGQVLEMIEKHRINCMLVVPTMIYALLDHPRFAEFDLSSLETVFYGASTISPVRLKEAIERIGPVFFQFYGQAEVPQTISVLRKADHDPNDLRRLASCGRPSPYLRVELQDSEGRPVPDGEPGEICVRGPLIFDGYRGNDELNAETWRGGWHHTGDVAVKDPDGFLRIVDRTKDMIVTGGFNVYPREVEDIIAEHPAVRQVAVIGVPDPKWGEAVKACVVLREGQSVDVETLCAMVAERKGSFQAPKSVDFVDAIPLTPLAKPDKKALRAFYAAQTAQEDA